MSRWNPALFAQRYPHLKTRQNVVRAIRAYFDGYGFDAVDTPVLQTAPGGEVHLHAFRTTLLSPDRREQAEKWLHTSPELAMKKLLVAGVERLYQICPVFRNAEGSARHSPEFTMLEWYRTGCDYTAIMRDCEDLLRAVARSAGVTHFTWGGKTADPFLKFERLSVDEAFRRHAGFALSPVLEDVDALRAAAEEAGVRVTPEDGWDDIVLAVLDAKIEPHLGLGRPTILYEYPASMAALSRRRADDSRWAERFELYVCGLELANAFSELTDPVEQKARLEADMAMKEKLYGHRWPIDGDFIRALESGMPGCAGIALGVDRLVMLAAGTGDIRDVQWL